MSDYTTKTASLKATAIDTRKIDAKQIDTEKLFINGTQFDPSQIKESPNEASFYMTIEPYFDGSNGFYSFQSMRLD